MWIPWRNKRKSFSRRKLAVKSNVQHNVLDLSFIMINVRHFPKCTEIQLLFMVFDLRKYKATFSTRDRGCKTFLLQTAVVVPPLDTNRTVQISTCIFTRFFFKKQCMVGTSKSVSFGRFLTN